MKHTLWRIISRSPYENPRHRYDKIIIVWMNSKLLIKDLFKELNDIKNIVLTNEDNNVIIVSVNVLKVFR
jgi:hypothetical protein